MTSIAINPTTAAQLVAEAVYWRERSTQWLRNDCPKGARVARWHMRKAALAAIAARHVRPQSAIRNPQSAIK